MKKFQVNRVLQLGAYVICYLLLLEWLKPSRALMNIDNMTIFIIFTGSLLLLSFFKVKFGWKLLFVSIYILFSLYYFYFKNEIVWQIKWLLLLGQDVATSIELVWNFELLKVPNTVQTILLFLLLWILTFWIHYCLMTQQRIFLFYFASILFVAVLDTFSPYNGEVAIIRVVILGFLLLGLMTFKRIIEKDDLQLRKKPVFKGLLALCSIVVLCSGFGFYAPKLSPQWPDPVPFIVSFSDKVQSGSSKVKKVGYGEDDSVLGGDFKRDSTIVFTAITDSEQYWKVETKDAYTGVGWDTNAINESISLFKNEEYIPFDRDQLINENNKLATATIKMEIPYSHVPYPNPVTQTQINVKNKNTSFLYNQSSAKVTSLDGDGAPIKLKNYQLTYKMPVFNINQLRASKIAGESTIDHTYYTALPFNFPEQIRSLAISLTEDKDNQYDKVKAIESYFQSEQFTYASENIPYPEAGQDFVEQFLFETQRGYCVHFSTAMAVLLRSVDIPTRWVKGYSPGEVIDIKDGKKTYQITNNNAHAWVEVYFEGIGWVPFEPTKGFVNAARFETTQVTPQVNTAPAQVQNETQQQQEQRINNNREKEIRDEPLFQQQSKVKQQKSSSLIWISVIMFLTSVSLGFLSRRKWLPFLWLMYFRRVPTEVTFEKAYSALLRQLNRCGLKRRKEVTLREFAKEVDHWYETKDMSKLTAYYEGYIYGGKSSLQSWKQAEELWKQIMKRTA